MLSRMKATSSTIGLPMISYLISEGIELKLKVHEKMCWLKIEEIGQYVCVLIVE